MQDYSKRKSGTLRALEDLQELFASMQARAEDQLALASGRMSQGLKNRKPETPSVKSPR